MALDRRLRKPLASLAVLLAALPVGELLVRLLTDVEPPLVMRDAELGRRFRPDFEGRVHDAESGREVLVRTTHEGFRGPERPEHAAPGVRRIAVIGDSMVAALSVEESECFCGLLEASLRASHPEQCWEVMNFGVLGSSTGQECLVYEQVARLYHPDLVLECFFSGNDLADNSPRLTSSPRIYFDLDESGELVRLPYSVTRSGLSRWLNLHSRLYVWQKRILKGVDLEEALAGPGMRASDWVFSSRPPEPVARAWQVTEALLCRFTRAVEADGARFCLVHLPGGKEVYGNAFDEVVERAGEAGAAFEREHPDLELARIAADCGVPLVSLTDALRKAAPSDSSAVRAERVFYGGGGGHLNELGHRIVAKALHEELEQLGLLDGLAGS